MKLFRMQSKIIEPSIGLSDGLRDKTLISKLSKTISLVNTLSRR